jgi:hypothetical protein
MHGNSTSGNGPDLRLVPMRVALRGWIDSI